MPGICWIFCARIESATSYSCGDVAVSEVSVRTMIGDSAGFTFRQFGFVGRFVGNCPRAALIAACTSRAAPSALRLKSNCKTMDVPPSELDEVICVMPAIRPNMRSRGAATAEAIVSGLAPGSWGDTCIVGYATSGKEATGVEGKATKAASNSAVVSSEVAIGRLINGAEIFIANLPGQELGPDCQCKSETAGQ